MDCEKLPKGLRCAYCQAIAKDKLKRAKEWFGQGEYDVDLMISSGVIFEYQILQMYECEVEGKVIQ